MQLVVLQGVNELQIYKQSTVQVTPGRNANQLRLLCWFGPQSKEVLVVAIKLLIGGVSLSLSGPYIWHRSQYQSVTDC